MKRYLLLIVLFCYVGILNAQNVQDKIIFKAMQDELERTRELKLPGNEKPFFTSFHFVRSKEYEIKGCLGAIISSTTKEDWPLGAVNILLGDYEETNKMDFGKALNSVLMPKDLEYNEIRRRFWLLADKAYKDAAFQMADKQAHKDSYLENELKINDWTPVKPIASYSDAEDIALNLDALEENVRRLSSIFANYPDLFETGVSLRIYVGEVYMMTSDGIALKYPVYSTAYEAGARTVDETGRLIFDNFIVAGERPLELSMAELEKKYKEFADRVMSLKHAKSMGEAYVGPVLFEGNIVATSLGSKLGSAVCPVREQSTLIAFGNVSMNDKMGMKVIDSKLTVKNYTGLREYKGMKVYGAYQIDSEGVVPEKEMTLIENGILRKFLCDRTPKVNAPGSTGSSRFWLSSGIQLSPMYGTLHIQASKGMNAEKLKERLLKEAQDQGLNHAYIIRGEDGVQRYVYKVDVKTGAEVLVNDVFFPLIEVDDMRHILEFSKDEMVVTRQAFRGSPTSIIAPTAMLLENFVIRRLDNMDWSSDLVHPLKRASQE